MAKHGSSSNNGNGNGNGHGGGSGSGSHGRRAGGEVAAASRAEPARPASGANALADAIARDLDMPARMQAVVDLAKGWTQEQQFAFLKRLASSTAGRDSDSDSGRSSSSDSDSGSDSDSSEYSSDDDSDSGYSVPAGGADDEGARVLLVDPHTFAVVHAFAGVPACVCDMEDLTQAELRAASERRRVLHGRFRVWIGPLSAAELQAAKRAADGAADPKWSAEAVRQLIGRTERRGSMVARLSSAGPLAKPVVEAVFSNAREAARASGATEAALSRALKKCESEGVARCKGHTFVFWEDLPAGARAAYEKRHALPAPGRRAPTKRAAPVAAAAEPDPAEAEPAEERADRDATPPSAAARRLGRAKRVRLVDDDGQAVESFDSMMELATAKGVRRPDVRRAIDNGTRLGGLRVVECVDE